jgi:4-hydroxybenzoate polyprenyltransferase
MYFGAVSWTLYYDTIYALQDLEDDIKVGIKSTAIQLQHQMKPMLLLFSCLSILGFGWTGYLLQLTYPYFLSIGCVWIYFLEQIYRLDPRNVQLCWELFVSNKNVGFLVLIGILLHHVNVFIGSL